MIRVYEYNSQTAMKSTPNHIHESNKRLLYLALYWRGHCFINTWILHQRTTIRWYFPCIQQMNGCESSILGNHSFTLGYDQWRHQRGAWGIPPPSWRLCPPPPCSPSRKEKIAKNQPFSANFWIFAPSESHFAPSMSLPHKKNSGAATGYDSNGVVG